MMHTEDNDVERQLHSALAQFANAEPRPGLEMRVLAGLQAERSRVRRQRRSWQLAGAFCFAAVVLAMIWARSNTQKTGPTARLAPSTSQQTGAVQRTEPVLRAPVQGTSRRAQDRVKTAAKPSEPPKLDQFPSPAPLTKQEQLLAQYVRQFPDRAVLVARAQSELRKQDEQDSSMLRQNAAPASSDQI